ncbi:MAG: hypothetical protein ACXWKG_08045 [Limisphaerales bacterium]
MKKILILSAAAALLAVQSATAVPTLTISDSNGNTTGIILDGGAGDGNAATGVITFNGIVGNWDINVSTGIASPPYPGSTPTNPHLDLNSVNHFNGGLGGVLTITFTDDNLGPISSVLTQRTGGTTGIVSDRFEAILNGVAITDATVTTSPFAVTQSGPVTAGTGSTLSIVAVLTATTAGTTSFDSDVTVGVPDAGMTLALLGSGLTGLALFARSRKIA